MSDLFPFFIRLFVSGFFATFPAAICTVGFTFILSPLVVIPLNFIRQKVLLQEGIIYTNPQIEQRIAKEHKVIHFLASNLLWIIFGAAPLLWLLWALLLFLLNFNPFDLIYYI